MSWICVGIGVSAVGSAASIYFSQPGDKVSQTPTFEQQQSSMINAEMWNYYLKEYKPVVNKWIERETSPANTDQEKRQIAGKINADVMAKVSPQTTSRNTVKNQEAVNRATDIMTGAQVKGQGLARQQEIRSRENIIATGKGEATQAMAGLNQLASVSVNDQLRSEAIKAQEDAARNEMTGSLIGAATALGTKALDKLSNWGKSSTDGNLSYDAYNEKDKLEPYWTPREKW